ncbi:MAG: DUF421 domain-containing protein [Clostridiales bacterium]|nr:DUF421 domain-containing protein [Clostridiales bacterium]
MTVIFIRTTVIFITLVVVMRLMGKRQIGEMQPFEFIVTLIVADLACIPMADVSIPLIYGIVAILSLFLLHQLLSLLETSGNFFKLIVSGKPSIVINTNGVDMKELRSNNLGIDDLIEAMRAQGYYALDDLNYAIFESNGKLSPLENPNRTTENRSVPLLIVNQGKINTSNINRLKLSATSVTDFLNKINAKLKQTEVMTLDGFGRVYIKEKNKKYRIEKFTLPEALKW